MESPNERRPPGRPRSEQARRAILTAALETAAEKGPEGLTMSGLAARADVSKETLYRWWRSKTEVLLEALLQYGEDVIPVPDTGSLADDVRFFMRATAQALTPSTRRILRTLAAESAADPVAAEQVRDQFIVGRRVALRGVLRQGVRRGELSESAVDTWLDLIFGSLWYRLVFDLGPLDDAWADAVTAAVTSCEPR